VGREAGHVLRIGAGERSSRDSNQPLPSQPSRPEEQVVEALPDGKLEADWPEHLGQLCLTAVTEDGGPLKELMTCDPRTSSQRPGRGA